MAPKKKRAAPSASPAAREAEEAASPVQRKPADFPVVGIGASAGGLEPMKQILRAMPTDTGMAFVVVQHLAPTHTSMLPEILSRETTMPVQQVVDEPGIRPNCVYVIPPDRLMRLSGGKLRLFPRAEHGRHHPIDVFLRSLAEDRGHRSFGVILSGTATDGTLGLGAIKEEGGITFAQDDTAQHDSMPKSALAAGWVDFVLPPTEIALEIARIGRHSYLAPPPPLPSGEADREPVVDRILELLRDEVGVDFLHYRTNTLYRRITRRMVLQKLENLRTYLKFLEKHPAELEALHDDILISVTSFFRNPEAFEALTEEVFQRLVNHRSRHEPLRIWVLGCSTGEEAYSIAMAFTEFTERTGSRATAQIFATDLSARGIEKARAGFYSKNIEHDVSPERLRRFFVEMDGKYRVGKTIRDMCIFARHNVLTDPPFSRIDLASCRNLLIYLEPPLQQKTLSVIHYALQPGSFLWLGSSESTGSRPGLFHALEGRHKFYEREPGPARFPLSTLAGVLRPIPSRLQTKIDRGGEAIALSGAEIQKEADRILLSKYVPPGVLIDADMNILQFRGDTSPYLVPAPGKASLNLLKMAREGLLVGLRSAIQRARKEEIPVRVERLAVVSIGGQRHVDIEVVPVRGRSIPNGCFLVVFDEPDARKHPQASTRVVGVTAAAVRRKPEEESDRQMLSLTQELAATREYLQSLIEQQEGANEELQSSNEEVQSTNEELQSINEELETSKEEIQSSNEELATVNEELGNSNLQLARSNNDLTNLIASVQMPIVMLGRDLRIRRFTPTAEKTLNLIATDVGRPISDIKLPVDVPELEQLLLEVIDTVSAVEKEIRSKQGRWYSLRLLPYKTHENKIDGAVLVLVDVDAIANAKIAIQESEERYRLLVEGAKEFAIMMLDPAGRVSSWNSGAERLLGYTAEEILASHFSRFFLPGDVAARKPEQVLRQAQSNDTALNDHWLIRKDGTRFWGSGATTVLRDEKGAVRGYAKVIRDISDRRALEEKLRRHVDELKAADRSKNEFLAVLGHELRNPLALLGNALRLMTDPRIDDSTRQDAQAMMGRQVGRMGRLMNDLLDIARITCGKIQIRKSQIELSATILQAVENVRPQFDGRRQEVSIELPEEAVWLDADAVRMQQVFGNLLDNASKFSPAGSQIRLTTEFADAPDEDEITVRVKDEGIGIDPAMLSQIFDLFTQADSSASRSQSGLGIGLTLTKNLVELHGGTIAAQSAGLGRGSEFVVRLPRLRGVGTPLVGDEIPRAPAVTRPRRILVVDDDKDGARALGMLLQAAGHEVRVVFSGPECLQAEDDFRPQAILLDLGLPVMDGFEVARRLRSNPESNGVFLIAISGYGRDEDLRRTREAGFDHHLVKPTDLEDIQRILESRALRT